MKINKKINKAINIVINKVSQTLSEVCIDETIKIIRFKFGQWKEQYNHHLMERIKLLASEIVWNLNLPNAKENQTYSQTVEMPAISSANLSGVKIVLEEVSGLETDIHGLLLTKSPDGESFSITGTPTLDHFRKNGATIPSAFELLLKYRFSGMDMPTDCPLLEQKIQFVINQDPRKLWRDFPVDWDHMKEPRYEKGDTDVDYVKVESLADGTPQKDIVAASKRGRSHAYEAKPRDDHFKINHIDNGWYIMAVADGAGSAEFSREGSRIACEKSVSYCGEQLTSCEDFENAIVNYYNTRQNNDEGGARKAVGDYIYKIVGHAAFEAHKSVKKESEKNKIPAKQYATTLLLAICKRFDFGWLVASFWVGDGAICLYDKQAHTAKILGVPDEGEYAGQTRFLTMPEIFKDAASLYQRLRFSIVDDFTALFMMTDGVSDPKFETDANLNNPDKWDDLWNDLKDNGVELTDDNDTAKDRLLEWLDFWSPGNHDDRTIAILYGDGDKASDCEKNTPYSDSAQTEGIGVSEQNSEEAETSENKPKPCDEEIRPYETDDTQEQSHSETECSENEPESEDVQPQKK